MATVNLGVIKPVFKGAYNNSTAYVLDNIVTSGGSSYICILASTGNAVSNATYWSQMSAIGTNPQLSMTWDNATADADNGAGKIAWNHATIASATILYVDDVDDAAASIATYVQSWDDVANATAKGIVTITKEGAPAVFATFKVTGSITDASGYSKIPVTHLVSAGSFSDGDGVAVSFAYSGLDGADGTDVGTVITTAGDVLYRDGSGLQRLAKGTAGQALIMNSGATAPEWGDGGAVTQVKTTNTNSNWGSVGNNSDFHVSALDVTMTASKAGMKYFLSSVVPTDDSNSTTYGVGIGWYIQNNTTTANSGWAMRPSEHGNYWNASFDKYFIVQDNMVWDSTIAIPSGIAANKIAAGDSFTVKTYLRFNNSNGQYFTGNHGSFEQHAHVWEIN